MYAGNLSAFGNLAGEKTNMISVVLLSSGCEFQAWEIPFGDGSKAVFFQKFGYSNSQLFWDQRGTGVLNHSHLIYLTLHVFLYPSPSFAF